MYDREEWLQKKEKKLEAAHEALRAGLAALETDADWQQMLRGMAVLGPLSVSRFSFTNQVMLQFTAPGAAYAATFKRWQEYSRSVKKGERAHLILQPVFPKRPADADEADAPGAPKAPRKAVFFRALSVFTLDQTEGADLPKLRVPDFCAAEPFAECLERLTAALLALPGCPVSAIDLRPRLPSDPPARGWYTPATREIVVLTDVDRAHQLKTLLHEAAHALLHGAGDHHSRPEQEVEAESTAFVVCHALGMDTAGYSFPYVARWAGTGDDALDAVTALGGRIQRTAALLLDVLLPGRYHEEAAASAEAA